MIDRDDYIPLLIGLITYAIPFFVAGIAVGGYIYG